MDEHNQCHFAEIIITADHMRTKVHSKSASTRMSAENPPLHSLREDAQNKSLHTRCSTPQANGRWQVARTCDRPSRKPQEASRAFEPGKRKRAGRQIEQKASPKLATDKPAPCCCPHRQELVLTATANTSSTSRLHSYFLTDRDPAFKHTRTRPLTDPIQQAMLQGTRLLS